MDYYVEEGDNVPYDYVVVYPPGEIDPAYIEPPRRARYATSNLYDDDYGSRYVPSMNISHSYLQRTPRYDTSSYSSDLDLELPRRSGRSLYEIASGAGYPRYDTGTSSSYLDLATPRRSRYSYGDDDDINLSYSNFGRNNYSYKSRVPDYIESSLNKYPTASWLDDDYYPKASTRKSVTFTQDSKPLALYTPPESTTASKYVPREDAKTVAKADAYLDKMFNILSADTCIGVPPEPTNVIGNVFVGTSANAENNDLLKRKGFTHLLNCGARQRVLIRGRHRGGKQHPGEAAGVKHYEELILEDDEQADIRPHLARAHRFIEGAKSTGAFILVYDSGVSRSGAIIISYLIRSGYNLLKAVTMLKKKRRIALCNEGFMKQLYEYAKSLNQLDPDIDSIRAPKFGGPRDKYRLMSAHLPTFL